MTEPFDQKLVILGADYTPQALSATYELAYDLVVQAHKDNDATVGAAIGASDVDPRKTSSENGISLLPSQNEPFDKVDLKSLYLSGKKNDRFLLRWKRSLA